MPGLSEVPFSLVEGPSTSSREREKGLHGGELKKGKEPDRLSFHFICLVIRVYFGHVVFCILMFLGVLLIGHACEYLSFILCN